MIKKLILKVKGYIRWKIILKHFPQYFWDGQHCERCGKKVRGVFGITCKRCLPQDNYEHHKAFIAKANRQGHLPAGTDRHPKDAGLVV